MNPFYFGVMRIKGGLYPHSYPPLISRQLFDRCEEVRLGSSRETATRYSEKPFVFKGLIKCATSRRTVTCVDKKARELKERQTEIATRIEQHQKGEGDFRATLEGLISLASRAAELFERSKIEQKRELIAFVFSNLRLRGKNLDYITSLGREVGEAKAGNEDNQSSLSDGCTQQQRGRADAPGIGAASLFNLGGPRPSPERNVEPGAYGLRKADIHRSPSRLPSCAGRDLSRGATFWTGRVAQRAPGGVANQSRIGAELGRKRKGPT
jgi:hypothetical protein